MVSLLHPSSGPGSEIKRGNRTPQIIYQAFFQPKFGLKKPEVGRGFFGGGKNHPVGKKPHFKPPNSQKPQFGGKLGAPFPKNPRALKPLGIFGGVFLAKLGENTSPRGVKEFFFGTTQRGARFFFSRRKNLWGDHTPIFLLWGESPLLVTKNNTKEGGVPSPSPLPTTRRTRERCLFYKKNKRDMCFSPPSGFPQHTPTHEKIERGR